MRDYSSNADLGERAKMLLNWRTHKDDLHCTLFFISIQDKLHSKVLHPLAIFAFPGKPCQRFVQRPFDSLSRRIGWDTDGEVFSHPFRFAPPVQRGLGWTYSFHGTLNSLHLDELG